MRFSVPSPTLGWPSACALLLQTGVLAAGLLCALPGPASAADDGARSYADARRRADLEQAEAQRECARMEPDMKTDCMARSKAHYEFRMSAARERYPQAAAAPLDPDTAVRFERELGECDRLATSERPGCRLDVKRRYRH